MNICRSCGVSQEHRTFVKNKSFKSGFDTLCVTCNKARVKQWRLNNPEKRRLQYTSATARLCDKKSQLSARYGLTLDDFDKLATKQNDSCAICGVRQKDLKKRLSVDHCHTTSKVRGLLCSNCNSMLGMAKDNIHTLESAILYLTKASIND